MLWIKHHSTFEMVKSTHLFKCTPIERTLSAHGENNPNMLDNNGNTKEPKTAHNSSSTATNIMKSSSPSTVASSHLSLSPERATSPSSILLLDGADMNSQTTSQPLGSPNKIDQELLPSCGAKQLAKLKRFLTTLQQFGSDISLDIGEKVRNLVLALVNSQLSIEEFHTKLQETTNFPLKPFVIPFLKTTLPILQLELKQCTQISKHPPQQYLVNNERVLLEMPQHSERPSFSTSPSTSGKAEAISQSHKRKSFSSSFEAPLNKRFLSETSSRSPNQAMVADRQVLQLKESAIVSLDRQIITPKGVGHLPSPTPIKLDDISRTYKAKLEAIDLRITSNTNTRPPTEPETEERTSSMNFDQISNMLSCVVNMVEKTKTALTTLQEAKLKETQELTLIMKRHAEGVDNDLKRRSEEMVSQILRQSEDRITEIKRRADDIVLEVKKQAVVEIQQAVAAAEIRANDLVRSEKLKMEKSLQQICQAAKEDAIRVLGIQCESRESCWNCGRHASETCSGCNKARYCGRFCQHKDWDRHNLSCGGAKDSNKADTKPQHTDMDFKPNIIAK